MRGVRRGKGIPPLLTIIVGVLCEGGEKREGHSSSANNFLILQTHRLQY